MPLQAARDGQHQAIADNGSVGRVNALELVDADRNQRRAHRCFPLGPGHGHAQPVEQQFAMRQSCQAALDGIAYQPVVGAARICHIADKADAFERIWIFARHAGRFNFKPAIAVVGVPQAEADADVAAVALACGEQNKPEAFRIGLMHMAHELFGLARQFAQR